MTTNRSRTFVDTDSARVREWAETVYESYKAEAVPLETFSKQALQEALARREATAVNGDQRV